MTTRRTILVSLAAFAVAALAGASGTTLALWHDQEDTQTGTGYGFAHFSFGPDVSTLDPVPLGRSQTVDLPAQVLEDLHENGKAAASWVVRSGSAGFLRTDGRLQLDLPSSTGAVLVSLTTVATSSACTPVALSQNATDPVQLTGAGGYHATEHIETAHVCLRLSTTSYTYTNTASVTGTASGESGPSGAPTTAVSSVPDDTRATWTQAVWRVPAAISDITLTYSPESVRALT